MIVRSCGESRVYVVVVRLRHGGCSNGRRLEVINPRLFRKIFGFESGVKSTPDVLSCSRHSRTNVPKRGSVVTPRKFSTLLIKPSGA